MDRCGHRTSSCPFLVNVLLDELEDELSPEDRGYRVEVPVEAAEHEQFKGLQFLGAVDALGISHEGMPDQRLRDDDPGRVRGDF